MNAFYELIGCFFILVYIGMFIGIVMCEFRLSKMQRMIESHLRGLEAQRRKDGQR